MGNLPFLLLFPKENVKLSLILGDKQHTVTWDKDLSDFPNVVTYDGKYWEWVCWDDDPNGLVDKVLTFGITRESALPVNMFGVLFPVPNLTYMFQLDTATGPCECGAKFTSFPDQHMILCPKWSKT
jgi:hypothetical protein